MENKLCKKCQRVLPDGYKYKKCEHCRNTQVHGIKNGLKAVAGVASTVAGIVAFVVTKGKSGSKK